MLRLLFVSRDETKRLTVITDGIDGQYNVFVTQNVVGDLDYFKSLGIVICAGLTYNIGQFKNWAVENALSLKGYPEELGAEEIDFAEIQEEYQYTLVAKDSTISFPKEGGTEEAVVTTYKQLYVNGKPTGNQIPLGLTFVATSPYQVDKSGNVTITENPGNTVRNATLTVTQAESNKKITINLTQAASTVTYTYNFSATPTSLSFVNTGETKKVTVTSTKQKVLNGKPSGTATAVATTIKIEGTGFTQSAVSGGYNVVVSENPNASQRTGKLTITANEGGKSAAITLTQAASVITHDYVLTTNPTSLSFVGGGESKTFTVTSTKQKKLNGKNSGSPTNVTYTTTVSGTGFAKGANDTTVTAASNDTEATRSGSVSIKQSEGTKTATISLSQAAGVVTYEYTLTTNPTSLSFVAAGETKTFGVSSNKQKKINGKNSGSPVVVNYTTVVSGTGFTKGASEYSVVAAANTGAQRTGSAKVTASEGGKTATVTLTQLAGTGA